MGVLTDLVVACLDDAAAIRSMAKAATETRRELLVWMCP
jgi:hypothetical protein